MKKRLWFTLLLLMSIGLLTGQTWIRWFNFGGLCPGPFDSSRAKLCNVIPAIGGGYLLQGYVEFACGDIPAYANNVFWKLDEYGEIVWRRTGGGNFAFNSIVSNGIDRYYCLRTQSGYSTLYIFDNELNWLGYYHNYTASLYDIQYVEDGLVFAGKVNGQAVVIKTDFQFNVVWQSDCFSVYGSGFNSIEPYDNGWISVSRGKFAHFTAVGDTIWTYNAVDYNTSLFDCKVSFDNNIYILGYYKLWRANLEQQSLELVVDGIPASYPLNELVSLEVLPNGNIVYLSRSTTNQILHSYSPDGVHQWSRSYDISGPIYFGTGSKNLLVMPDGSILFCMYHNGYVLIKTDSNGNVTANDDPVAPAPTASIICYPQPAANSVMVSVKSDLVGDLGYSIINIKGQKVYSGKIDGHHREQSFELPNEALDRMPNGIYLISLEQGKRRIAAAKLVVVK